MKKLKKLLSLTLTCAILIGGTLAGSVRSSAAAKEYFCPKCGDYLWNLHEPAPNCTVCGKEAGQYICIECDTFWYVCLSGHCL